MIKFTRAPTRFTPTESFWGGGHTVETLPSNKGWRCRPAGVCWVVGQRGKRGCASIRVLEYAHPAYADREPALDVAIYLQDPKEVHDAIMAGGAGHLDPRYVEVPILELGGEGLNVLRLIEEERRSYSL